MLKTTLAVISVLTIGLLAQPPGKKSRDQSAPKLPRPEFLLAVGAGHRELLADVVWLGMLQQIGIAETAAEYRNIYPYGELATELDRHFLEVYRFAGVTLPFNKGREEWVNVEESNAILRKGLVLFPKDYRLKFTLAFNLMQFTRDYKGSAELFSQLADEPGAPEYFRPLATRLFAQGGAFDEALVTAQVLRDNATDDESRKVYERRVLQIQQERVLQAVDAAVKQFQQANGKLPADVSQLVDAGLLPESPKDPLEGRIFVDAEGRARSTSEWYRLQLYDPAEKKAAIRAQGPKADFVPEQGEDP